MIKVSLYMEAKIRMITIFLHQSERAVLKAPRFLLEMMGSIPNIVRYRQEQKGHLTMICQIITIPHRTTNLAPT